MKRIVVAVVVLFIVAIYFGRSYFYVEDNTVSSVPSSVSKTDLQHDYGISISATAMTDSSVKLSINTNIPLPVRVAVSISLKGQKPKDIYIGLSEFVTLRTAEQTFVINTSSEKLPTGDYIAEVTFYPLWGAKNGNPEAQIIKEEISDSAELHLIGTGESVNNAKLRDELQVWVMNNVFPGITSGTKWEQKFFVSKLGSFEKINAENRLQDAYYFPNADMTIIVYSVTGTVAAWRMGRAAQ